MDSSKTELRADDYVSLITSNRMSLLEFVEKHKSLMTNEDADVRSAAFELLESVITRLSPACFSELEAEQIAKYCSSVFALRARKSEPLLAALHYLVTHFSVKLETLKDIVLSLLKRRIVISNVQLERSRTYAIILEYLDRSQKGSDASDITNELLRSADGEIDPRCLIILFKTCEVLAEKFELGPMREDLFDFMVSYFPVSFKAPTVNPSGITHENLEDCLNLCLTASDWLAEYLFGHVGGIVDSSLTAQETNSYLKLLSTALGRFSRQTVRQHGEQILKLLVPLILWPKEENDGESEHIDSYSRLVDVMFFDDNGTLNEYWTKFAQFIAIELQTFYCHPEIGVLSNAHRLLFLAAGRSDRSFWFLFTWATDRIFEVFQLVESSRQDYAKLLLDWCEQMKVRNAAVEHWEVIRRVKTFAKENLLASNESPLNDIGVAVIINLALGCSELVEEDDAVTISLNLIHLLSVGNVEYSRNCFNWYGFVAEKFWPLLKKTIYPLLTERYDTALVELNAVPPMMAASKEPAQFVLVILTRRIMLASSEAECMAVLPFVRDVLSAINLKCESDFQEFCRIVFAFAVLNFGKTLINENGPSKAQVTVADAYGKLLQDMFLAAPTSLSQWYINEVVTWATSRKDTFFQSSLCLHLFVPVICAASAADLVVHEEFLLSLWKIEPCRAQPTECKEWCRCSVLFSCVAHHMNDGSMLNEILDHWADRCDELFHQWPKCYRNLGYLARALLLRNHPTGVALLEKFFAHLRLAEGNEVIEALQIVYTSPSDAAKNECFRRLAPFYKERIVGYSVQLLRSLFQETQPSQQKELNERACEVFALLFTYAPSSAALTDFQFILPMLDALSSSKESVRNVAVEFLHALLSTKNRLLNDETELIRTCEALLSCCSEESHVLFCSRVFSCLRLLSLTHGSEMRRPLRYKLVNRMLPFLNHKKRLVRQAAAEAVNTWQVFAW